MNGVKCDVTGEWFGEHENKTVRISICGIVDRTLDTIENIHIKRDIVPEQVLESLEMCCPEDANVDSEIVAVSNISMKGLTKSNYYQPNSEEVKIQSISANSKFAKGEQSNTISISVDDKEILEFIDIIQEAFMDVLEEKSEDDVPGYTRVYNERQAEDIFPLDERQKEHIRRNKRMNKNMKSIEEQNQKSIEEQIEEKDKETMIVANDNNVGRFSISVILSQNMGKYLVAMKKDSKTGVDEFEDKQEAVNEVSRLIEKYDLIVLDSFKEKAVELGVIDEEETKEDEDDTSDRSFL